MAQPPSDRAERLAAALRANLRRRKEQVRGDAAASPAGPPGRQLEDPLAKP